MKKFTTISMLCAALSIGACDHYSEKLAVYEGQNPNVAAISPAAGEDITFSGYLANEYLQLAEYENNTKKDYKAAKYYTAKIEILNGGQMVAPATVKEFKIDEKQTPNVMAERDNLISALQTYNIPENRQVLAKAQSRYDCWLEQLEDHPEDDIPLTCETEYKQAMASLALPLDRDIRFAIPFDETGSLVNGQAQQSFGKVLNFWNNNQGRNIQVSLLPPSGVTPEQAEQQISTVRGMLEYNGIPSYKINILQPNGDILVPKNNFEVIMRIPSIQGQAVPII
ncbi:MAG: hypothetical protein R3D88_02460 [Alphaproteobacteria bacterium]|nr:hypothetical protein [Alphaproteobacteria bacterium]